MSGVAVDPTCLETFQELKLGKKLKYIVYRMSPDKTSIIVDKKSDDASYEAFIAELPEAECRWAVYDLEFEREGGKRNKLAFYSWCVLLSPRVYYLTLMLERTGLPMTRRSRTRCCSPLPRTPCDAPSSASPLRSRAPIILRLPWRAVRAIFGFVHFFHLIRSRTQCLRKWHATNNPLATLVPYRRHHTYDFDVHFLCSPEQTGRSFVENNGVVIHNRTLHPTPLSLAFAPFGFNPAFHSILCLRRCPNRYSRARARAPTSFEIRDCQVPYPQNLGADFDVESRCTRLQL
jgi:hypothetical protein